MKLYGTMKRGLLIATLLAVSAIFIYCNKLFYPPLPIDSLTSKEAIQKLNTFPFDLVALSNDKNVTWYIPAKIRMTNNRSIMHLLSIFTIIVTGI